MGIRKFNNVVSFNEYRYSKYDSVDLRLDVIPVKKERNIRCEMIKGYLKMISNQIK